MSDLDDHIRLLEALADECATSAIHMRARATAYRLLGHDRWAEQDRINEAANIRSEAAFSAALSALKKQAADE
jgi:hypothetical protein